MSTTPTPIFSTITDQTNVILTEITTGLWSPDDTGSLAAAYTSSIQKAVAGEYFYDVYNLDPSNTANNAEVQFGIAYGHIDGGGSPIVDPTRAVLNGNSVLPTKAVYSQYRNILLTSGSKFKFGPEGSEVESDDIYVININRARMKQALDPGNWQLGLSGSNGVFTFVDTSTLGSSTSGNIMASSYYNIRSGSLSGRGATYPSNDTTVYGIVFPDYGAIILHPAAISASVGFSGSSAGEGNKNAVTNITGPFAPYTGSDAQQYQYQHEALLRSISGSMSRGKPFIARSVEAVNSKNYSVLLQYNQYNYSNNPSYYTLKSDGTREILEIFKDNPKTYITTIGLYNDSNDLIAVAKLSRPLAKSKDKSALIRVRLDY
jgi:hypothetical protein